MRKLTRKSTADKQIPELKVRRGKDRCWWIYGALGGPFGPYERRPDAEEDRRGLDRFYRYSHRRDFVTADPRPKR